MSHVPSTPRNHQWPERAVCGVPATGAARDGGGQSGDLGGDMEGAEKDIMHDEKPVTELFSAGAVFGRGDGGLDDRGRQAAQQGRLASDGMNEHMESDEADGGPLMLVVLAVFVAGMACGASLSVLWGWL